MKDLTTYTIKLEVDDMELRQAINELDVINVQLDKAIAKLKEAITLKQRLEPDSMKRMDDSLRILY